MPWAFSCIGRRREIARKSRFGPDISRRPRYIRRPADKDLPLALPSRVLFSLRGAWEKAPLNLPLAYGLVKLAPNLTRLI